MNFTIENKGDVSNEFLKRGIKDFKGACDFISKLPYKRNRNKKSLLCVFEDKAGTCSTKHSTLRKLALENDRNDIKLILGIFKMDAEYTKKIENTLNEYGLEYIPEAHNYLKIVNEYYDFTNPNSQYSHLEDKILEESEIEYNEIYEEKIKTHKLFFEKWIQDKPQFDLEKIWEVREKCIFDLQN